MLIVLARVNRPCVNGGVESSVNSGQSSSSGGSIEKVLSMCNVCRRKCFLSCHSSHTVIQAGACGFSYWRTTFHCPVLWRNTELVQVEFRHTYISSTCGARQWSTLHYTVHSCVARVLLTWQQLPCIVHTPHAMSHPLMSPVSSRAAPILPPPIPLPLMLPTLLHPTRRQTEAPAFQMLQWQRAMRLLRQC